MDRTPAPRGARVRLRPAVLRMIGRVFTALLGGYAATAALAALSARLLPIARVEATVWSMTLSFLAFALIGLWCFHEPRLARVAAVVWGIALTASGTAWVLGVRP